MGLKEENGVVLIAVLWVFAALAIIALSFSKDSFIEMTAARNSQSLENSYFVARAGISAAVYHLIQRYSTPKVQGLNLQDVEDPLDSGIVTGKFGGGLYRVVIEDESGKLNPNMVQEDQLRALVNALGIQQPDSDIITDSIMDWRDTDVLHRMNGAEDDYYQSQNPPYKAKNGRIETLEELLLIRGITPDYFYGHPERSPEGAIIYKYGLSRCLTVFSNNNQINVNSAPIPVLMSINGMTPEAAQAIYQRRLSKPFKNRDELQREMSSSLGTATLPFLTAWLPGQPGMNVMYTLTASAGAENSKVRRVIRTVVAIDAGQQKTGYRTLYWNENVPDYEGSIQ
jgi:general secretion pathway protein K